MLDITKREVWFVVRSQSLYGDEVLDTVRAHALEMAESISQSPIIPVRIVLKPVMTSSNAITQLCLEANKDQQCIGLLVWMHTFSRLACGSQG